ncbi:TadE family protein [Collimonas humicola]|uniref:TadE family protein n=1 Tax=Collimonas humicola TaxID=2825886 RepID=UPI0022A766DC|nr:TadE family protein [Collimonas humicola]
MKTKRSLKWRSQHGAASVEFYVVSFFVFIPMVMAVLQLGLFFVAKNTVNLATFAAARAGAAAGGDKTAMANNFAKAVVPLFANTTVDVSNSNYATVFSEAYLKARVYMALPLLNSIEILNPTSASFTNFGIPKPGGGGRIIPTTNIMNDNRVLGGQTRADALLLKIEVRFCYRMPIPIIDKMVSIVLLGLDKDLPILPSLDPKDIACYSGVDGAYGIPIKSQAVIRMTEPPESGKIL